ncbi:MAG: murein biosynthesis integral membrane protein MurJ [Rhodoglobus sp.]|nr:murein biosynthesis integral membrane protein MurJ [Rhodoglobus sp.]
MTESSGIGRASALLASGTLVSRILGFVNAIVLAAAIGYIGAAADGFTLATQIPNSIYALIAGGLLSAVLVPQIVRAAVHDDGGQRFINRLVTLGIVVFLLVAIAATLAAPLLVNLYAQSGERGFTPDGIALATALAYWCLPQIFFYSLYSLLGQVLNARNVFGPFTWAPALNNVIAIAGIGVFILLFGPDPAHRDASTWTPEMVALLGGTATVGIAAQALVLTLFWKRAGLTYRPDFRWRGVGLGRTGTAAAWVFGMILVTQLAAIVETRVATLATGSASLGALKYAWLIFMLPHSIVTVSIATAYFTRMSGHARDGRLGDVRTDLSAALRAILLVMVFATVGLAALSYPFSAVFGGDFEDVSALATVIIAYLVGLIPFTVLFLLQRVFYSLEDTRTVFFMQVLQSVIFVVGVLLVAMAPTTVIAIGIALVMSVAGTIQTVVSALLLRARLGGLDARRVLVRSVQYLGAALVAGALGAVLVWLLGGYTDGGFGSSSRMGGLATMAAAGLAMAVVYFGILWIARNPELRAFAAPIQARLGRRS